MHAEHGVDHRIEGDVVRQRGTGEKPRVAEDHVMQLVQDQHEEVFVGAAMFRDELRIEPQARARRAINAGGRHRVVGRDVEQAE